MTAVFYDHRWIGTHGIGRFANELQQRLLGTQPLPCNGDPLSPLDAFQLGRLLNKQQAELFITPGFNVPFRSKCPTIATVHDLIHVNYVGERSWKKSLYYKRIQAPVIRNSPVVFTVSEYSASAIVDFYNVPRSKVCVVGNGVSPEFVEEGPAYEAKHPYILYVGNAKSHKNLDLLLQQFVSIADRGINLVLVCRWSPELQTRLQQLDIADQTQFVFGISDAQLATYYRGALCLVFPSLYEGYGLPAVEAMACGCPVVAADRTALPEILGGAGVLFDPSEPKELREILLTVAKNKLDRSDYRQRGLDRARAFSWGDVAQRATDAIHEHFAIELSVIEPACSAGQLL